MAEHRARIALRRRVPPIAQQRRGNAGQRQRMIGHVHRAVARNALQFGERARKRVRIDRFALDQPAIAERGTLAGPLAVHHDDIPAPATQVQRHRDAHDARAEYQCRHCHLSYLRAADFRTLMLFFPI